MDAIKALDSYFAKRVFDPTTRQWVLKREYQKVADIPEPVTKAESAAPSPVLLREKPKQITVIIKKCGSKLRRKREFKEARIFALERDCFTCQDCGSTDNLHVHHIIHKSKGGSNSMHNLVTVCAVCHAKRHINDNIHCLMEKTILCV